VPAPRFDRTPGKVTRGAAAPGGDTRAALCAWGFTQEQVDALVADGTVVQRPS
jgi:alpha-methylacyl-CoA racemase